MTSRPAIWIAAARPRTLAAAVVPIAVGTACAASDDHPRWGAAAAALAGAVAIQIATNFANDLFDAARGADGPDRIGPARAVASGQITPRAMAWAIGWVVVAAVAAGLYLVTVAGWPIIVIGTLSILSGLAYTGGPYPLAYHGLGDVFVLIFFGVVAVCGTAYVQLDAVPPLAIAASLPVGALATAILVVNNLRDVTTDERAGKRTLAVWLGRRAMIGWYGALLVIAYAIPLALAASGRSLAALPLATAPFAFVAVRALARAHDATTYQQCLAGSALLLICHGGLFSAGIALG